MNYKDAQQVHSHYQFLIGKKGRYSNHTISDVLIIPTGNEKAVRQRILSGEANGIKQVTSFTEDGKYAVVVLFHIGDNYLLQDISLYTHLG
jgi:hypothetical protein